MQELKLKYSSNSELHFGPIEGQAMISNILQIYFFLMNFNFWPMLKKCYPSPPKIEPTHLFLDPGFCII